MGYNPNCLDLTLADVVGTDEGYRYSESDHFDEGVYYDDFYDEPDPEDDRPAYFHGLDVDEEAPAQPVYEHDPHELVLPLRGKIGRDQHARHPTCPFGCCYSRNLRPRRHPKYNSKPKRKDHRA